MRLNLRSFASVSLHNDLKYFQGFSLPQQTTEGRTVALDMAYKVVQLVFPGSEPYEEVLAVVFDEAANLAQTSPDHFRFFLRLSHFQDFQDRLRIFAHFVKQRNFVGFNALNRACPRLFGSVTNLLRAFVLKGIYWPTMAIVDCLAVHPNTFGLIFDSISAEVLMFLLSAGLPFEVIMEILFSWLKVVSLPEFFATVLQVLVGPFNPFLPKLLACFASNIRAVIFIAYDFFSSRATSKVAKYFRSLVQLYSCRFNLAIDEAAFTDGVKYDVSLFKCYASICSFHAGNLERALEYLPDSPSKMQLNLISGNEKFIFLLVVRRADRIESNLKEHQRLPHSNRDWPLAFHDS